MYSATKETLAANGNGVDVGMELAVVISVGLGVGAGGVPHAMPTTSASKPLDRTRRGTLSVLSSHPPEVPDHTAHELHIAGRQVLVLAGAASRPPASGKGGYCEPF